jgi:DNA-binding NarL/FixJ family response regulator
VTCVVADDHPSVVDAVCRALGDAQIRVVAQASEASEAIDQVRRCRPEVALIDIKMPGPGGVDAVEQIRAASPETRVLLYTGHAERQLVADALASGAHGVLLKGAPLADLAKAIRIVSDGGIYVDQSLAGVPLRARRGSDERPHLTAREHEVLRLLADGDTNDQVATKLAISADTVQTHVRNAMKKLGAETRTQAVATAMRVALIR